MEKKFSKIEIAMIKRTAQNVAQFVNKKEKFNAEIEKIKASRNEMIAEKTKSIEATVDKMIETKTAKLQAEIDSLQPIIDSFQIPVKNMTGGYTTEDLISRVVEGTGKIDEKSGKEIMQTRFVLKYPETVIPVTEDLGNADLTAEPAPVAEIPEAGNDFDADAEAVAAISEASEDPFASDGEVW